MVGGPAWRDRLPVAPTLRPVPQKPVLSVRDQAAMAA
jgi:hypothetical protein